MKGIYVNKIPEFQVGYNLMKHQLNINEDKFAGSFLLNSI